MRKFKTGAYVLYNGMVWCITECGTTQDGEEPHYIALLHYTNIGLCTARVTPSEVQLLLTRDDLDRLALQVHEATTCQS